MFSTNFLLNALEWLQQKFHSVADKHREVAKAKDEVIKEATAVRNLAQKEAQRARTYANKIATFLEGE